MTDPKKPRCHNCKHGSKPFKIAGLTHLHCLHPKHADGLSDGTLSAWDTLREFSNGCASHEAKTPTNAQSAPNQMQTPMFYSFSLLSESDKLIAIESIVAISKLHPEHAYESSGSIGELLEAVKNGYQPDEHFRFLSDTETSRIYAQF